ncbi:hypothetical protein SAMN05216570_3125 [Dyella sp. OK004]|uniref:hypothetical protein n=1 Tax=Dyella sp. OK004 TaxID=1855292 RepID=UPI0008EA1A19|nr:hypothetical protein [Dyella sp. OK004]SFS14629.1 hypothetical protein SAMN05216570_3125 [Dyella sp. OK004]
MSHATISNRVLPAYPTYRGMGDGPVALLVAVPRARPQSITDGSAGDQGKILLTTNNGRMSTPDLESDKPTTPGSSSWWRHCIVVLRHLAQQGKA